MKLRLGLHNVLLALILVLMPIAAAYSQDTGTSPQSGTSSPSSSQTQPPSQPAPPGAGETETQAPQAGVGNTAPSEAPHRVAWGWLILGFVIGALVGAFTWMRAGLIVRENTRRDRAA